MALPPIPQHQLPPHRAQLPPHRAQLPPHPGQLAKLVDRKASAQPPPPCDSRRRTLDHLSNSWPSATLRRHKATPGQHGDPLHPARRFLEQVPVAMTRSCESVIHPRPSVLPRTRRELPRDPPGRRPAQKAHTGQQQEAAPPKPPEVPLSLRLTPEAILVIQKRSLEKQRSATNARRLFASSGRCPRSSLHRSPPDVSQLLKISLLNEQHRYDDMEYEDECWLRAGEEGLVRKCTEWLQGVEMATGRGVTLHDKLQSLPHLNTF
ncbi:proline-rich protein 18 [Ranitomeya imitator]|uniref:proline-rich protein 18 n=1 Tax=Ranitomeya imitator TaxID=111125 RepID=UPI0037E7419D